MASSQADATQWVRSKKKRDHVLNHGDRILAFDVGQRDLGVCVVVVDKALRPPLRLEQWEVVDLGSGGTVRDSVRAFCQLVHSGRWDDVDVCVIEQQARVNIKMVALSHSIQASLLTHRPGMRVVFASSCHKFSVFQGMPGVDELVLSEKGATGEKSTTSAYAQKKIRKVNAIRLVACLLASMPDHQAFAEQMAQAKAHQKDDLADSLVYAAAYVFKNEDLGDTRHLEETKY